MQNRKYLLFIMMFLPFFMAAQIKLSIPEIQGKGSISPYYGEYVSTSGVVTFVSIGIGSLNGYFLQDKTGDGDPATSDGIFVSDPYNISMSVGDEIELNAYVDGDIRRTHLNGVSNLKIVSSNNKITPQKIIYTPEDGYWSPYNGMLVELDQTLYINSAANLERYGELELGVKRRPSPTNVAFPGTAEYSRIVDENDNLAIFIDDGYAGTYMQPIVFADSYGARRTGERVDNLVAVVNYINNRYVLYPIEKPVFYGNSRPAGPVDLGAYNLKVCAFNLEYYLTQPNSTSMGPGSITEMNRQHTKLLKALQAIDADVYGLAEVEQGQNALRKLTNALNSAGNGRKYAYVQDGTSVNGTYTKVGYIYRSDKVSPYKSLREIDRPTPINRKKLQAFTSLENGERFILGINHFKAKSGCQNASGADRDQYDGQSCFNATRLAEAQAVIAAADAAVSYYDDDDILILGDLNAYAKEDPIQAFVQQGYIDLLQQFQGDEAYTYVYRGEAGVLDHALANRSMAKQVTGASVFHINADELGMFGYDGSNYASNMYRSSDHDPVVVGLAFGEDVNSELAGFEKRVKIYPTVAQEWFRIDRADGAHFQLYSMSGVLLFEQKIEGSSFQIDIPKFNLSPGAYLVRVLGEGRIVRQIIFVK